MTGSGKPTVWRIEDGERHWVIADTSDAAIGKHISDWEFDCDDYVANELLEVVAIADDQPITIRDEDTGERLTLTAAQWIARDYLGEPVCIASTAW